MFIFISGSYHQIISSKPDYSFSHERKVYCLLISTIEEGIKVDCFDKVLMLMK